jgi:hypothetical protein
MTDLPEYLASSAGRHLITRQSGSSIVYKLHSPDYATRAVVKVLPVRGLKRKRFEVEIHPDESIRMASDPNDLLFSPLKPTVDEQSAQSVERKDDGLVRDSPVKIDYHSADDPLVIRADIPVGAIRRVPIII